MKQTVTGGASGLELSQEGVQIKFAGSPSRESERSFVMSYRRHYTSPG
jgi:hypothetical protein